MGFVAEMPIEFKLIGGLNIVYIVVSAVLIIQQDILQWGEFALAGAQALAAIAVYYVYRQQKDIMYLDFTPDVRVLQYGVREDRWHPLYFELTNIGKGRASDISIQLEPTPVESTKFSFESDSVSAEKMQGGDTEGKYSGIGDYLIPTETAEFKSLIPQVVWYGSGGSEGRFDLGTVSDTLQENNIDALKIELFVVFEFPDGEIDRNKFFDKVVPLVKKGGIELALERNFDYDLYKVMDDYGKSNISDAVLTEDDIGKIVQWTGVEEEGTIVGVARGRATVEMNDGSEKQVRSQDIVMHLEDLVLIDENN